MGKLSIIKFYEGFLIELFDASILRLFALVFYVSVFFIF